MNDDLWRELAQVNREKQNEERERLGEHWDRLSSGELSPEEEAELRALAETSDDAREAFEAFRPLGPEFHASVVRAVREQADAETKAAKPKTKLLPFPQRATRFAGWSAVAGAVAAAVLVLFLRPPAPPLPDYALLEISGGVSAMRGERPEALMTREFEPVDHFRMVLQPKTAVSQAKRLEARCFLYRGQDLRHLEVQSQIEPSGAVRMEGAIPRDLRPGTWTLWAVVGRRGELPEPADLLSAKAPVRQRDWVAVSQKIRLRPREDLQP